MGYYAIIDEVTEIEQNIVRQLEDRKNQLNDVWNEMNNYIQCLEDNGSGEVVGAIKGYIKEVHIEQISKRFVLLIDEMTEKITKYADGYREIEKNWKEGKIAQESLEEQQMIFKEVNLHLNEKMDEVEATLNGISDIMGRTVLGTAVIEAGFRMVSAKIEALKQTIGEYEESHKDSDFVTMEELMSTLVGMIGKYSSGSENITYEYESVMKISDEATELLKKLELENYQLEDTNIMIYDKKRQLIGMMPYYVMINGAVEGTFVDDGGITIGYGHHINEGEWLKADESDHILLAEYVPEDVTITGIEADRNSLPRSGIIPVEGAEMVPIEVIEELLEQDIQENCEAISAYLSEEEITLTQKEFDALVIYRYNRGHLSSKAMEYLKEGNRIKEDWEKIWTGGVNRKVKCQELFFGGNY